MKMLSGNPPILLLVLILVQAVAQGQSISISLPWQSTPAIHRSKEGNIIHRPTFTGAVADYHDGYLPHYSQQVPIAHGGRLSVSLNDEVYEPVTDPTIDIPGIASTTLATVHEVIIRKEHFAAISLMPLRRNTQTGAMERLIRCTATVAVSGGSTRADRSNTWAAHSVLATGTWYKVGVSQSGVYKLDYTYLKTKLGFDLTTTPFSTLGVFGTGGGMVSQHNSDPRYDDLPEIPTRIVDNNGNNRVDDGDYLLFYGQGPDRWVYDTTNAFYNYEKNLYSRRNYYFISPDRGTGKRVSAIPSASSPTVTSAEFDDYAAHEEDKYNPLHSGTTWVGDKMSALSTTTTIAFNFSNLVTTTPIKYYSVVAGSSNTVSTFNVSLNGSNVFSQSTPAVKNGGDGLDVYETQADYGTLNSSSDALSFTYTFNTPDGSGASVGYIGAFYLNAKRHLSYTSGAMSFRNAAVTGLGKVTQFNIANANNIQVWDVTDIATTHEITGVSSGSTYSITSPTDILREFVALTINSAYPAPDTAIKVATQDLHATGQPTMIIICPDELLSVSNDYAGYHTQHDGYTVKVATLQQVYNEYGSGKMDISAIRDYVRMIYERAGSDSSKMPRYLLLMGDGSYDPLDRVAGNNNLFPTYQTTFGQNVIGSYTTDDFFGCLDPGEGGDMDYGWGMDIAVGRIPAADALEATGILNKIKLYTSTATFAAWRNNLAFISDVVPTTDFVDFQADADIFAEYARLNYPQYNTQKIYLDLFHREANSGGARYPDCNTAILNRFNIGTLIISYTGHGGVNNWSSARIFNLSDIQNLENHEKLPLMITATCDFGHYDDPEKKTAGEYLVTNTKGGAIAMLTTVRPVYESENNNLQSKFFASAFQLYHGRTPTIGELVLITKNNLATNSFANTNMRCFALLGDPALKLNYPQYSVVTTKLDSVPIAISHDTLKALKYVTISGEVRNGSNQLMNSFNGQCFPTVYDKISLIHTLRNLPDYPNDSFNLYTNSIFKGQCSVTGGKFNFSFIVPKDINYKVGLGRINYYATGNNTDANGYQNDLLIGGAVDTSLADKDGPKIKLYMNDEKFVFGGITTPNPKLYAKLQDASGINTTGNGLGHDLTAVLDADSKNPIVLNEYYQSELNSYKKGTVSYPLLKLTEGRHTLRMKAWDILDNSSEDHTEFVVASSASLALKNVFNYPNPFTTSTKFMFEHNRPGDQLTVLVQIFSVTGRLVKSIREEMVSDGFRVDNINWDGLDDHGDKIGRGVYVYKVHIRDTQGNTADQFQKLVVLK